MADENITVNVHHHHQQIRRHLNARAINISDESSELMGTAGAVARVYPWLDGRNVLIINSDMWLSTNISSFVDGWDGTRTRLLVVPTKSDSDFGMNRYIGAALMPNSSIRKIPLSPHGLYEALWQKEWSDNALEVIPFGAVAIDCGTPTDYVVANLLTQRINDATSPVISSKDRSTQCVILPPKSEKRRPDDYFIIRTTNAHEVLVASRDVTHKFGTLANKLAS